jgi:hypothetical protein
MDPAASATLFRSRASWPEERATSAFEEIAAGPLAAMVRLVLTDPDAEFWPYRVEIEGHAIDGDAIVALDRQFRGQNK